MDGRKEKRLPPTFVNGSRGEKAISESPMDEEEESERMLDRGNCNEGKEKDV